uniref:HlyD family type I secretion periplasmic adaptor subunit n=1 Tax=Synechococcus sp. UW106 TaxID=368495 RepID=UPI000E0F5F76|nr:HlyD family type I secretion periplasmic adaptor subunit [Synechococcus sp. UW106]
MNQYKPKLKQLSKRFLDLWNDARENYLKLDEEGTLNSNDESFRQAIEIEDPQRGLLNRRILIILTSSLVLSIPITALTPITQVVDASGNIVPKGNIFIVNNLEGGVVTKVNVENGQYVKKGETLINLNPSLIKSDIQQRVAKTNSLRLQQEQLKEALTLNNDARLFDSSLTNDADLKKVQEKLLEVRIRNHKDQINVAEAIIKEKEVELTSLGKQLDLAIKSENMWRNLTTTGAASKLKLLTTQSQTEQIRGKRNEIEKALIQAKLNLTNLESDYELTNTSSLANLESEEYVTNSGNEGKDFELDNMTIKSPVGGIISDLRFNNIGSVIVPGDQVLSVVPINTIRQAKIRIPAKHIGFISVGQKVNITLLPFRESEYGSLNGTIEKISGSTVKNEQSEDYYYESIVDIEQQYLQTSKTKIPFQVGMPLVAEIKTNQRSLLGFLLEPFTRVSKNAFEE